MSFLSPLALLGLLFVPVVLAMYLLRLRRDERVVPSTLLWHRLLADVEANAPWQRLRRSLLLLLQLLLVLLLAVLAARPFLERPAGLAGDVVVVIDTSASMGATDVPPDRLTEAKARVLERLRDLPADGKVSVIAAGRAARVVVSGTSDLGRVRAAIDAIRVEPATGDLGDALALADALAARAGDAEILVATDAALARQPTTRVGHPVSVVHVGRERRNQAIVALAVRPAPSGVTRSVFLSVANLDIEPASRRLELYADGILIEARELATLDPQTRTEVIVDDVPLGASVIEARLAGDANGGPGDVLALDDRAWAIVPQDRLRRILIVGPGDPYLETALSYLPSTELYGITLDRIDADTHLEKFDLIIFEGDLPATLPQHAAILAIAPTSSGELGEIAGELDDPAIGTVPADDPVLRYVDLSNVHVGRATELVAPAWARTIIPGPGGSPLLYAGELGGRRAAVLAFLPRNSDLPLQVAFPILLSNLAGELLGASSGPAEAVAPGDPVILPLPASATGLSVTRPDGSVVELAPAAAGASSVAFAQTDLLGVYDVVPQFASPDSSAGPDASADGAAGSGAPAPSGSNASPGSSGQPDEPVDAVVRFAVDLFDPGESDVAPGSPSSIAALGRQPGASETPGASPLGSPGATAQAGATAEPTPAGGAAGPGSPTSTTRDELWTLIVLAVLAVLTLEWLVYQRDAVARLWRGFRRPTATPPRAPR